MTCPRSHSGKSQTDSQVLYHQSGILRPPPTPTEHGLGRKGYSEIECLVCWTEQREGSRCQAESQAEASMCLGPQAPRRNDPKAVFASTWMEQNCTLLQQACCPQGRACLSWRTQRGPGLGPCQGGWHWLDIPADWTQ